MKKKRKLPQDLQKCTLPSFSEIVSDYIIIILCLLKIYVILNLLFFLFVCFFWQYLLYLQPSIGTSRPSVVTIIKQTCKYTPTTSLTLSSSHLLHYHCISLLFPVIHWITFCLLASITEIIFFSLFSFFLPVKRSHTIFRSRDFTGKKKQKKDRAHLRQTIPLKLSSHTVSHFFPLHTRV